MEQPNRGRYVCQVCGSDFALNASLKVHMQKRSHFIISPNGSDSDSGISSVCGHSETEDPKPLRPARMDRVIEQHFAARLPKIAEVKSSSHSEEHFNSLPDNSSGSFCKCVECNKIFDSQDKLAQHQRSKNHEGKETIEPSLSDGDFKTILTKSASVPSVNVSHLKTFTCASCARSFDSLEKLAQHNTSEGHLAKLKEKSARIGEISKLGNEPTLYICNYPDCGKVFNDRYKLDQHQLMKKHSVVLQSTGQTVDEKSNTFPQQEAITEVETTHKSHIIIYRCRYCGKGFHMKTSLIQHMTAKFKDKIYIHPPPDNNFLNLSNPVRKSLNTEMNRLNPDSSTKSESATVSILTECVGASASAASYRKLCDQCEEFNEASQNKNFIFLTFIAKHFLKNHAPNYVRGYCPICNLKMEKTKNLLVHIARSHLLPKFKDEACFICLRLCKDRNDLQEHTTSVHRYKCLMDECNSMFASKALRDKHMLQKHGVHVCNREDCHSIFTSIDEKRRHINKPHPVATDSDSGMSSAYSHEAFSSRNEFERGAFSEPTHFNHHRTVENQHPYSADELSNNSVEIQDSSQNAAFKLFKNHMQFLRTALKELKEPLKKPVNPLCVDEALNLCNEVMGDISEIRDHYRRSRHRVFDIDLIGE